MSKPKIIWLPGSNQTCTIGYCTYGIAKIALDHEVKADPEQGNSRDKFRIRCLSPRKTELSKPVTFQFEGDARQMAELEARRIHHRRALIDFNRIEEWRAKAQKYDDLANICGSIGRKPEQAAYELAQLCEMTGEQEPAEIVALYLDTFERVRAHMALGELVLKQIKMVERSKKAEGTKEDQIKVLKAFESQLGAGRLVEEITCEDIDDWYSDLECGPKRASDSWYVVRHALRLAFNRYDILSAYPVLGHGRGKLAPEKIRMAMAVQGKNRHYRWKEIGARHWLETAKRCGMGEMKPILEDVLARTLDVVQQVHRIVPPDFPAPIVDAVLEGINARAEQLTAELAG